MSKILKKLFKIIYVILESIYKLIDKIIIMPISRLVYNITKVSKSKNVDLNKYLSKPNFLIYLSLILALIAFLLIDNKVVNLVENEAEIIKNIPVNIIYNEEAFVVENVPEEVDITITGRKSDIYLAKQLGDFRVELDLSKYTEPGTYKVKFTYSKSIESVNYNLDPSYVTVTIKDKVSEVHSVTYDLINDDLDGKLSVNKVTLDSNEVIIKGSQDVLDKIASVKALVDVTDSKYDSAGTYEISNIPLVAYDKKGKIVENVEIVPSTLSGTVELKSYKQSVPLNITTTGKLVSGRAIASLTINNASSFTVDIYGEENDIKKITSVPVDINIDGLGKESTKTYNVTINKPNGVRYISTKNVTINVTFGDEEQKTIDIHDIGFKDGSIPDGYTANIISNSATSVQVKGVKSNISNITESDINAYVDLSGLGEGTHEVEVKIDNNNPLVSYVVSSTITIKMTKN